MDDPAPLGRPSDATLGDSRRSGEWAVWVSNPHLYHTAWLSFKSSFVSYGLWFQILISIIQPGFKSSFLSYSLVSIIRPGLISGATLGDSRRSGAHTAPSLLYYVPHCEVHGLGSTRLIRGWKGGRGRGDASLLRYYSQA